MEKVYEWLSNYYEDANITTIKDAVKTEKTSAFLITWSIFETELFGKYCTWNGIKSFASANEMKIKLNELDAIIRHFHHRYQDVNMYRNLRHKDKKTEIDIILNSCYESLDNYKKLLFITYVVYRYRNNIFHGNKSVRSWLKFDEQIGYCFDVMMKILNDCK